MQHSTPVDSSSLQALVSIGPILEAVLGQFDQYEILCNISLVCKEWQQAGLRVLMRKGLNLGENAVHAPAQQFGYEYNRSSSRRARAQRQSTWLARHGAAVQALSIFGGTLYSKGEAEGAHSFKVHTLQQLTKLALDNMEMHTAGVKDCAENLHVSLPGIH
jgi:hypothetical protein